MLLASHACLRWAVFACRNCAESLPPRTDAGVCACRRLWPRWRPGAFCLCHRQAMIMRTMTSTPTGHPTLRLTLPSPWPLSTAPAPSGEKSHTFTHFPYRQDLNLLRISASNSASDCLCCATLPACQPSAWYFMCVSMLFTSCQAVLLSPA